MAGNSELKTKSTKRGPNILCRRYNISPENICKLVKLLPKEKIPVEQYREIMGKIDGWFGATHQSAEQWGLFYFDDNFYYPRFDHDISSDEASNYLYRWIRKFPITNPYATFKTDNTQGLVLSIVKYMENNPQEHDLKNILESILPEPFVCNDILANAIDKYSKVLSVKTLDSSQEVFEVKLKPDYKEIIKKDYMDKKSYFELFDDISKTNDQFPQQVFTLCKDDDPTNFVWKCIKVFNQHKSLQHLFETKWYSPGGIMLNYATINGCYVGQWGENSSFETIKIYNDEYLNKGFDARDINAFADAINGEFRNIYKIEISDEESSTIYKLLYYHYINDEYRQYLTALRTKPFMLLAGISGTGKSRIVRELARACWDEDSEEYKAHKPSNYEMVQVKPNWHDSSELIGYVSRVSGEAVYVAGDFLKFVAKAWENPDVPYFLCLDEMNLAPVEQYFAEYLSVIESRKVNDEGKIVTDPILKVEAEQWYYDFINKLTENEEIRNRFKLDGICIPQNLIVVGTVNMDETTFSFSRKVLDRAMTIEMNEVDLERGLEIRHEKIGKLGKEFLIGHAVEGVDVYKKNKDVCDIAINYLKAINEKLEGTPFKIAYRTRNEFLLYVVNNLPYNQQKDGTKEDMDYVIARALDEITSMKILSRIEGDESKVSKTFLNDLSEVIKEKLEEISGCTFAIEETDDDYKSVSLAKLDEMIKRLDSGYTSFWS